MPRPDPPIPSNLGKAFLESLREEFPEEFGKKPLSIHRQLQEMDQIVAVERNFLDNPDPGFTYSEKEEQGLDSYLSYKDRKKWLEDESQ